MLSVPEIEAYLILPILPELRLPSQLRLPLGHIFSTSQLMQLSHETAYSPPFGPSFGTQVRWKLIVARRIILTLGESLGCVWYSSTAHISPPVPLSDASFPTKCHATKAGDSQCAVVFLVQISWSKLGRGFPSRVAV